MRIKIKTWNEEKQEYTICFIQKYDNIFNNNNDLGTLILLD